MPESIRKPIIAVSIALITLLTACRPASLTPIPGGASPEYQATPTSSTPEEEPMIPRKPLIIAHRGARSLAPENTLSAARKAVEAGADMWELDVSVTADGELFIMHDDTLERTCNVKEIFPDRSPWNVQDFTLEEVQRLDCGSWFVMEDPFGQIAAGNISLADLEIYKGEKAPTLREALEFTKANRWAVNIEIKEQPDDATARLAVEKTVALVEELGMDDGQQVVISSFEHIYLSRVMEMNPNIPIQILTNQVIGDLESYLTQFNTHYVNPKDSVWNAKQLREMAGKGILFNVWTVNDENDMKALIDAKVNGIITDFPQSLKLLLQ